MQVPLFDVFIKSHTTLVLHYFTKIPESNVYYYCHCYYYRVDIDMFGMFNETFELIDVPLNATHYNQPGVLLVSARWFPVYENTYDLAGDSVTGRSPIQTTADFIVSFKILVVVTVNSL